MTTPESRAEQNTEREDAVSDGAQRDVRPARSTTSRRASMRLMAIALSLSPLVALEFGLRWFTPPVVNAVDLDPLVDLDQLQPLFVLDASGERWEIPPERMNFFRPDSFLAEKPPGARRVFVLGGSTVQGRPYSTETSFSSWLRLRLEAADPDTTYEVINCGGVSYASYRVSKILEEVLRHQADAVVIYTGHNEFLEDREYAAVREMGSVRKSISRVASHLRTVTWLQTQFSRPVDPPSTMAAEVDARLDHTGGLQRYRRDPAWRRSVESHFAETLRRMILSARRADVPLVLCEPAKELVKTAPFKVQSLDLDPADDAKFGEAWREAQDDQSAGETRLSACETCLQIDPEHAGAHYIAGRLRFDLGDGSLARSHLIAASDFDVCPLRATSPIAQAVSRLSKEYGVPLVRTTEILDQRDAGGKRVGDGIADPRFFVDHVHPTVAGHQLVGAGIAKQLQLLGWFNASDDTERRYQTLAEQHLNQLGEAYFARGRQRLEGLRRWAAGRAGKLMPIKSADQ